MRDGADSRGPTARSSKGQGRRHFQPLLVLLVRRSRGAILILPALFRFICEPEWHSNAADALRPPTVNSGSLELPADNRFRRGIVQSERQSLNYHR